MMSKVNTFKLFMFELIQKANKIQFRKKLPKLLNRKTNSEYCIPFLFCPQLYSRFVRVPILINERTLR